MTVAIPHYDYDSVTRLHTVHRYNTNTMIIIELVVYKKRSNREACLTD